MVNRAEQSLAFWRSLVGLDPSFPSLEPLRDEDLLSLMVLDPAELAEITSSLGSRQLTQIVVEPGWGCTTLYRYLLKEARDNAMPRLMLPVSLDLETMLVDEGITYAGIEGEIKRQVIGLLIDNPWEASLNQDYYFDCINYDSSVDLASYKARMRLFLADRPPPLRRLEGQFPWLRGPLNEQLNYLLSNFRMQTVLYFHLPSQVAAQQLRDLVGTIKTTHETGRVDYAAWREVYVCSPFQRLAINRDFQRPYNVLQYPRYSAAQIYAMLVKRYTPNVPGFRGRNQVQLSGVFAEEFVHRAWADSKSLQHVMQKLREAMLRRLDCELKDVPFQLQPLEREREHAAEAAQSPMQPTAEPVRRRFLRRARGA